MSFGSSSSSSTTKQNSQSEPWGPAVPYLAQFLKDADLGRSVLGPSADQIDAYANLKRKAATGMPWLDQINQLTSDAFGVTSRTGMLDEAYGRFQEQLGDVAAGKNQDILSDPRIQAMLQQVSDDVQSRIQGVFAGAGRDVTGNAAGQKAIARGVSEAQLPILMQEFARQQGRTDAAIRDLMQSGASAAQLGQSLDANALAQRTQGVDLARAFLNARDLPENTILNIDQQLKSMPFEDLSLYASLLLPVAGLGGQQAGKSKTDSSGTSFGISF